MMTPIPAYATANEERNRSVVNRKERGGAEESGSAAMQKPYFVCDLCVPNEQIGTIFAGRHARVRNAHH
jgi:hypothetical protein